MGIKQKDILLHMQVPGTPGLYVLGVFESRVTVYSQQVRALNLIYSLSQKGWLRGQAKVAVIGAGVAGLTAAAAAAYCGAEVVMLEQLSEPLSLIGRSTKRWLHPHIYEWPKVDPDLPDPLEDEAGLPLMNWRAGTVNQVREQLLAQYEQFGERLAITLTPHVADISILPGDTHRFSLTWNEPVNNTYPHAARRSRTLQCDVVILAVGFGLERQVKGMPFLSYWSSDNLDEEDARFRGRAKRILVSGTGDGGLIDVLRIRLRNFSHHTIVKRLTTELLDRATLEWLTGRLNAIEAEAERAAEEQKPYEAKLNEEYQKLGDELATKVDIANLLGIRPDTQAILTGLDDHPLSLRTSVLNRLLYSALPDVKYLKGPWTSRRNRDGSYKVTFAGGASADFDEILIRHGPDAALKKDFPAIWKQCTPLMARSILDQTRFPIYGDFFGGPAAAVSPTSRTSAGGQTPSTDRAAADVELNIKLRIRRASALGLAAVALLILIKTVAENTYAGRWFNSLGYESLRAVIPPHERHEALPVVVVDISSIEREPETPVAALREIIEALAATNARAIGIAINFSPRNGPLGPRLRSEEDPKFFKYLHDQRNKGVTVFLGAHTTGAEADTWLGFKKYNDLAAEITGFDEDMTRAPRWVRCGDDKLNSLSKALADAYGTRPEPPALLKRFLLDPDAPESLEPDRMQDNSGAWVACERAYTLVNYDELERIQDLTLQATDRNTILSAKDTNGRSRFEGKLVIVGDAQRDETGASFVLFGRSRSPVPSSHIDAAAVYSIVGEPIYRFKPWVTVALDILVGLVVVLGLHHIRWRHRDDAQASSNRRESRFITLSILVTLLLGCLVVKSLDVLWLDFFLVVFAWLLHSEVQRRMLRLPIIPSEKSS